MTEPNIKNGSRCILETGKTYVLRIILEKDAVQLERALLIHELKEAVT
jgi:hypothetical protein